PRQRGDRHLPDHARHADGRAGRRVVGGRKISSGGMAGTSRHDQSPNRDNQIFVNTRARSSPPSASTYSRASRMWRAWGGSPASRSAAYASIVVEWSGGPP